MLYYLYYGDDLKGYRRSCRRRDNSKVDLKEIGVDIIRYHWRALVNMELNPQVT